MGRRFKTKKELKEVFGEVDPELIERIVEPAPFSHARQNFRGMIQSILDACAPVAEYKIIISGPNNFRYKIATLKPYKGNRDRSEEPVWRKALEEFALEEYGAVRTDGYEADDLLAVEFLKDPQNSIICSLDKDFMQLIGLRMYRWDRGEHVTVDKLEAARNFYVQLLKGDTTDNIAGVPGMGEAKSRRVIEKLTDPKVMLTMCYSLYQKEYGKDAWKALEETARLIYLCRTEKDLEQPEKAWKPIIKPQGVV